MNKIQKKIITLILLYFLATEFTLLPALGMISNQRYHYDQNGNTVCQQDNKASMRFAYNSSNQLINTKNDDQRATNISFYSYNHEGMRIKKIIGGKIKGYIYDQRVVMVEKLVKEDIKKIMKYNYGLKGLVSLKQSARPELFYHYDDHGSIVGLTGVTGEVIGDYIYDPWGRFRGNFAQEAVENKYTFTGKEFDEETELLYFGARYYDSKRGIFTTQDDSIWGKLEEPLSQHMYLYCQDNPVKYVDLNGNQADPATLSLFVACSILFPLTIVYFDKAVKETLVMINNKSGEGTPGAIPTSSIPPSGLSSFDPTLSLPYPVTDPPLPDGLNGESSEPISHLYVTETTGLLSNIQLWRTCYDTVPNTNIKIKLRKGRRRSGVAKMDPEDVKRWKEYGPKRKIKKGTPVQEQKKPHSPHENKYPKIPPN
ncbi:MAG: RHS repeat-associated core domain-containing protein [bacterium]